MKETACGLPQWIWHAGRDGVREVELTVRFELERETRECGVFAAFTGEAKVILDGTELAAVPERPGNAAAFGRIAGLPETLRPGAHELTFRLRCTEIVPLADVNGYLHDRRVGFAAYVQAKDVWIVSDGGWLANGEPAAVVCLLGEEPFGELEGGPEWFVRGGFGDIVTHPIAEAVLLSANNAGVTGREGGFVLEGIAAGDPEPVQPEQERLELFYHLRKQHQWKVLRGWQSSGEPAGAPAALFDLVREYNARFRATNRGDGVVTLLWNGAESLHELANYDGCITETVRLAPGETRWTLPQGMRYTRVCVLGAAGASVQVELAFEGVHAAVRRVGSITSDVPLLARIYETSAHTSLVCQQAGLWDGIKRDRLNWTFDFYLAAKSCYFLWDHVEPLKRAVRELGAGTPYGRWMNGIAEYTLWWVKTLCEYYAHTGDRAFVMEMKEPLARHLAWIGANLNGETGRLEADGFILIEWSPLTDAEKRDCLQAVLRLTIEDLDVLARQLPELELDVSWRIPELDASAFIGDGRLLAASALGIRSGYVSGEEAERFLREVELQDPYTPLSAYQLAECCSIYGLHEKAYAIISAVWGGMLEQGATTFWESYTQQYEGNFHDKLTTYTAYDSYRMSLCHAWSSTPVKWISETVLGVAPLEPGFSAIRFDPQPVGGLRSCSGTVNTPHGPVGVSWTLGADGAVQAEINAPAGIRVERRLGSAVER